MVRSKFNFNFYLIILFIIVFISISVYGFSLHQISNNRTQKLKVPPAVAGIIFLLLTGFLIYIFSKVVHFIVIKDSQISIKGAFRKWELSTYDIESINLFSKENFHWTSGSVTIGTRIELHNGQKIIIADPFYKNITDIKNSLIENFKDKILQKHLLTQTLEKNASPETEFQKFSGNPYTSINGVFIYAIAIFFGFMIIRDVSLKPAILLLLIPGLIFFLIFAYQLNYFLISSHHLIVKNHFLPWINKKYIIADIVEVNFESPHKRSDALRITTSDFRSKLYEAGSLRTKHWDALRKKLLFLNLHFVD